MRFIEYIINFRVENYKKVGKTVCSLYIKCEKATDIILIRHKIS